MKAQITKVTIKTKVGESGASVYTDYTKNGNIYQYLNVSGTLDEAVEEAEGYVKRNDTDFESKVIGYEILTVQSNRETRNEFITL